MSYSKSLRSNKGPLWVAAYCFKQLKKAHVLETHIPSSVDKILQDEMDAVSYRVLAYLLLGVVRIYSKKVEYLLLDCNELLVRVKKFKISTKDNALVESLRMSVIIPDRFELDAFDLDILEDAVGDGGHIATQEEITLKDVLCNSEGFGQFSLDKFETFDFCQNTSAADHTMKEGVCQSHQVDLEYEVFLPESPINLCEGKDISQKSMFSPKEPMRFDTVLFAEGVEKESVDLFNQDRQINEDQEVHETVPYEDEILEERSTISREKSADVGMFSGREKEPVISVEAFNESHQVDEQQSVAKETSSSLCQMHQEVGEVHEARKFQESMERAQEDKSYRKECMDYGKSSVTRENFEELIEGSVEGHEKEVNLKFQEKVLLEDEKHNVIPLESKFIDATPQSKFQGGSIGKPKPGGAATLEFMPISTPAVRERALFSRKRKIVIDGMMVLPNKVIKESLHNTSDLISNRRNFRRTLLAVQRQSRISSLPDGFHESMFPCCSLELRFLFSKKKMKISDSLEIVGTQGKFGVSESQPVTSQEHIATSPQTPPQCPGSLELDVLESRTVGSPEHIATPPRTPPQCPKLKVRSIEQPERTEIQNSVNLGTSSPHESIESKQISKRDEELNLMEEEINSSETQNSELLTGWSERTRKVARYLHRSLLDLSEQQRDEEVLSFSQVVGGRIRKECARLFYEILVLGTTSYVDVKQNNAYGDIAVRKLPKLDLTFGINDLLKAT